MVDFNKIKRAAIIINEAPDRGYGYGKKYWRKDMVNTGIK